MRYRLARVVGQQVLFRDVGDIGRLRILGQQVIERLVAARPRVFRDRRQPLLGIGENRIHVEDHATERIKPVLHHLPDGELGLAHRRLGNRGGGSPIGNFHDVKYCSEWAGRQRA